MKTNSLKQVQQLFKNSNFYKTTIDINFLKNKEVILYGAGECSHWFVEIIMKMYNYTPKAVLDMNYKEGMSYEGIPAFHPEEYQLTQTDKKESIVVISVGNPKYFNEIEKLLQTMGFQNTIFLYEIYEIHNFFNKPKEVEKIGFNYYLQEKNVILDAFKQLTDEKSKELFYKILQIHMTKKATILPFDSRDEQYFPKDILLSKGYSNFINCGAYNGDVIRLLQQKVGKINTLTCFEIDPKIFQDLVSYVEDNKTAIAENIHLFPCAIYNKEIQLPFICGTGLGSRIDSKGESLIQCISLDHILPTIKPTFISMDIEGVELEALEGAKKTIQQYAPDLGICVYHNPNHLWKIINYLYNLDLGYTFYLRNYTGFTTETVLYATISK